jgi:hypothetical protein
MNLNYLAENIAIARITTGHAISYEALEKMDKMPLNAAQVCYLASTRIKQNKQ